MTSAERLTIQREAFIHGYELAVANRLIRQVFDPHVLAEREYPDASDGGER
jgi:hypothetical protein